MLFSIFTLHLPVFTKQHAHVIIIPVQPLHMSVFLITDVDECAQPALRQCSLFADCNNTVGSYCCACRQGYVDVDPRHPGAHCTG